MNRKKELKQQYLQTSRPRGIYLLRNTRNGKLWIDSSLDIPGSINRVSFELRLGKSQNQELQRDWRELGEDAFEFEVLAKLKDEDDPDHNYRPELESFLQLYLSEYAPYGEKGYNKPPRQP